jgi:hypothetical protein
MSCGFASIVLPVMTISSSKNIHSRLLRQWGLAGAGVLSIVVVQAWMVMVGKMVYSVPFP